MMGFGSTYLIEKGTHNTSLCLDQLLCYGDSLDIGKVSWRRATYRSSLEGRKLLDLSRHDSIDLDYFEKKIKYCKMVFLTQGAEYSLLNKAQVR